jgi:adenylylsulfate kinase
LRHYEAGENKRIMQHPHEPGTWGEACTVWLTGLSGSGKSTLGRALAAYLADLSLRCALLDGDEIRQDLCQDLGFEKRDRDENVRRIGCVAHLLNSHGVYCVVAAISPYRQAREEVRTRLSKFLEVYLDCPLETLMDRDVKELYKRALAGEIKNFSGISDCYEPPLRPDVYLNSGHQTELQCLGAITLKLRDLYWIPNRTRSAA